MGILAFVGRLQRGWSSRTLVAGLAMVLVLAGFGAVADAAPAPSGSAPLSLAQNVDWLTAESAARLDLGFDVLVPTAVPGPFGGEPSIQASAGSYSLYWWIPGEPPTFLQITGTVGGALPAGSPYDLNIQLEINASVQGYPAIQDVSPIYDNVWWQAGNVVYMVSSRNLTETDSLSLANALVSLALPAPAPEEPEEGEEPVDEPVEEPAPAPELILPEVVEAEEVGTISVQGVESATLVADAGLFVDTGSATYDNVGSWAVLWEAPYVAEDTAVGFQLVDPDDGSVLSSGQVVVAASPVAGATEQPVAEEQSSEPPSDGADESAEEDSATAPEAEESAAETGTTSVGSSGSTASVQEEVDEAPVSDGTSGLTVSGAPTGSNGPMPSDGTEGPPPPLFGTDGTGGVQQVVIPTNQQDEP